MLPKHRSLKRVLCAQYRTLPAHYVAMKAGRKQGQEAAAGHLQKDSQEILRKTSWK